MTFKKKKINIEVAKHKVFFTSLTDKPIIKVIKNIVTMLR